MMELIEITDLNTPELAPYAKLTEAQLKQAGAQGLFIAESEEVIEGALHAGYPLVSMLTDHHHLPAAEKVLSSAAVRDIPVYTGEAELLEKLTGFRLSRGVLAAMERIPLPPVGETISGARRIAVLEGVSDAANIGAIFRSAAGLGMDAVLVGENCCDPLNRRAARVSMGAVFRVPWTVLPTLREEKNRVDLSILKQAGFKTAAMALRRDSIGIGDPALHAEEKLALLLGSEGWGLKPETIAESDYTVLIPMENGVDSLNVGAAAAIAFYVLASRKR